MLRKCLAFCLIATVAVGSAGARAGQPEQGASVRDGNALWMRRHWLHEAPSGAEIAALVAGLRERGIRRIYPFSGRWTPKAGRAGGPRRGLSATCRSVRARSSRSFTGSR